MQRTRRQILDILKKAGRSTLEDLARGVSLSPVTVRVHLSVLQRDGLVTVEEVRGRVGRPYFVYSLTEQAEDLFPKRYHVLAARLLRGLNDGLPPEMVRSMLERVAETWAEEQEGRLAGKELVSQVAEVARIRTEEGAIAEWEEVDGGFLLKQYNCPNLAVARRHGEVCRLEEHYISRMLGVPVTHLTSIGQGDRICSYLVREG